MPRGRLKSLLYRTGCDQHSARHPLQHWLLVILSSLAIQTNANADDAVSALMFSLEWNGVDRTLTADLERVPLTEFLISLSQKINIQVQISPRLPLSIISGHFDALPIETGLRKLLQDHDYMLGFDESGMLAELVVMAEGEIPADGMVRLAPAINERSNRKPLEMIESLDHNAMSPVMKKALLAHAPGANRALAGEAMAQASNILNTFLNKVENDIGVNATTRRIREKMNDPAVNLSAAQLKQTDESEVGEQTEDPN